jgi:hypothetical protein
MRKYITIPSDVSMLDPISKKPLKQVVRDEEGNPMVDSEGKPQLENLTPVTFREFVLRALINDDPRWGKNTGMLKASVAIQLALDEANGVACILKDDWEKLCKSLAEPKHLTPEGREVEGFGHWKNCYLPQFMPFIEAIEKASDRPPEEKKAE